MRPLAVAQALGVFNVNAFLMLSVFAVLGFAPGRDFIAIAVAYFLPFLLFFLPVGRLGDRFQKRNVMAFCKAAEFVLLLSGSLCLWNVSSWGIGPLACCLFLLSAQLAVFSPAFQAFLPETFAERDLSHANGWSGFATAFALLLGYVATPILLYASGSRFWISGLALAALSIAGLLAVMRCDSGRAGVKNAKLFAGLKALCSTRPLVLAALGDALLMALAFSVQALTILTERAMDHSGGALELSLLLSVPAIGMMLGCLSAARISGGRVEMGLVPFGVTGLSFFLFLAGFLPGGAVALRGLEWQGWKVNLVLHPPLLLWLFLAGLFAGFFAVPLRAYLQQRLEERARGAAFACVNALALIGILLFGAALLYFKEVPPGHLFIAIGLVSFGLLLIAMILQPAFALRAAAVALTHSLYKLRVDGPGEIPERGPALLVSNHVSFVDGLLISCCTSRMVRFLMHEDYYNHPLLNPIARTMGFISVPSAWKAKSMVGLFEEVKEALKRGELVCVFPEGRITRNGMLDEFKDGFQRMLPEDAGIPVIPIRLGMIWGSLFSYYYGRIRLRLPMELPHPASITIGLPVSQSCTAFHLRQVVSLLGAESELRPRENERPLHYQLARNAKRHPFRKAFIDQDGSSLSCFSLLVRSVALSWEFRRLAKGERILGVLLPNCSAAATAFLAIMTADKIVAPLNFSAGQDAIEAALRKGGIKTVITSRLFIERLKMPPAPWMVFLEDIAAGIPLWRKLSAFALSAFLPHQELMNMVSPESHRDVFKTAVLLFSSGSSGSPKGVMLSHHNINSDLYSCLRVMGWTSEDRIVGSLPMFHSFGLTTCFWLPLMLGCEVAYVPNPLDAQAVGDVIREHKLTILLATPTFIQTYMRRIEPESFKSLRLVIVGAEKLRWDLVEKFKKMTGLTLIEGFGCTELSPIVSINVANSILDLGKEPGRPGSIGSPMPGICAKIVDPETHQELPPDTEGLMLVRGANVMQGYIDDPEATEAAFIDGWYNTGDIARMDSDGHLTISGRLSRFSKIGGEMIPHELIEAEINEIAGIDHRVAAVCSAPDASKGERLLVLHVEMALAPEALIEQLRERNLPNLWIPKLANFRKVASLPLLGSGKLDLVKLRAMAAELSHGG